MTPKDKAEQLIKIHFKALGGNLHENPIIYEGTKKWDEAKICAAISCDEIFFELHGKKIITLTEKHEYWIDVKKELLKM